MSNGQVVDEGSREGSLHVEVRRMVEEIAVHAVEGVVLAATRRRSVIDACCGSGGVDASRETSKGSEAWISFLEELLSNQGQSGRKEIQDKRIGVMKKHSRYNLYQVKALQQYDKFSCGYFALYLACRALYALQHDCSSEELHSLACRPGYYHYKALWQQQLRCHAREVDNYYPWDDESIATGIVERPYLLYLIDNDPELQALGGGERLCALHDFTKDGLSQGIVGMERLQRLDFIAGEFKRKSSYHQAFIIGSIAHWMVVVVRKVCPGKFESIFIDSYNHMIMEKSHSELEGMVNEYLDAHPSKEPNSRPRRLKTGVGIHRGMQFALEALHELIVGDLVMVEEGLRLRVERFVRSYCDATRTVLPNVSEEVSEDDFESDNVTVLSDKSAVCVKKSEYVDVLFAWLHEECHPRYMANEAEDMLSSCRGVSIRPSALAELKSWLDHLDAASEVTAMIPADVLTAPENLVARFFAESVPAFRAVLCQCNL